MGTRARLSRSSQRFSSFTGPTQLQLFALLASCALRSRTHCRAPATSFGNRSFFWSRLSVFHKAARASGCARRQEHAGAIEAWFVLLKNPSGALERPQSVRGAA